MLTHCPENFYNPHAGDLIIMELWTLPFCREARKHPSLGTCLGQLSGGFHGHFPLKAYSIPFSASPCSKDCSMPRCMCEREREREKESPFWGLKIEGFYWVKLGYIGFILGSWKMEATI